MDTNSFINAQFKKKDAPQRTLPLLALFWYLILITRVAEVKVVDFRQRCFASLYCDSLLNKLSIYALYIFKVNNSKVLDITLVHRNSLLNQITVFWPSIVT